MAPASDAGDAGSDGHRRGSRGGVEEPAVTMRSRQQLVRALVNEIIVDIDEAAREIVLIIHWKGGQHSELRLRKPRTGNTAAAPPTTPWRSIRSMASRWSDQDIAATLNRMGLPTGQGKTWTAHRVSSIRRVRGIHAYKSAEKDGTWLTLREAASDAASPATGSAS